MQNKGRKMTLITKTRVAKEAPARPQVVPEGVPAIQTPEPEEIAGESFLDLTALAIGTENIIGAPLNNAINYSLQNAKTPNFSAFESPDVDLTGYEDVAEEFVDANSITDVNTIKRQIDDERIIRDTLDRNGWTGAGARVTASLLDPTIVLAGLPLFKALFSTGSSALKTGGKFAAAGASYIAFEESILQTSTRTRKASESYANVAAASVLSFGIGAGLSKLAAKKLSKDIMNDLSQDLKPSAAANDLSFNNDGSVGAAKVDTLTLEQAGAKGSLQNTVTNFLTPQQRLLSSSSLTARKMATGLSDNPIFIKADDEGIARGISVENHILSYNAPVADAKDSFRSEYVKYTKRVPRGERISKPQFRDEVSKAGRRGDRHEIQEVAVVAKSVRIFNDKLANDFVDSGIWDKLAKPQLAESYVHSVYDNIKINRGVTADNGDGLKDVIVRHLGKRALTIDDEFDNVGLRVGAARSDFVAQKESITKLQDEIKILKKTTDGVSKKIIKEKNDALKFLRGQVIKSNKIITRLDNEFEELQALRIAMQADELDDVADKVINKILGNDFLGEDIVALKRGALNQISLRIPRVELEPWLVNDFEQVMAAQMRSTVPEVALTKKYGSTTLKDQLDDINREYDVIVDKAKTPAIKEAANKERNRVLLDVQGVRDQLRNTFGKVDASSSSVRIFRALRQLNFLSKLGGMALSAISDPANQVFARGLTPFLSQGVVPLLRNINNIKGIKKAGAITRRAGAAVDISMAGSLERLAEVNEISRGGTVLERGLSAASDNFGKVSGMSYWNDFWKRFSGIMTQNFIFDQAKIVAAGGKMTKQNTRMMARVGLDSQDLKDMFKQFDAHSVDEKGLRIANEEMWTNPELKAKLLAAIQTEANRSVVTPKKGGLPLMMGTEVGKTVFQFKSFVIAQNTNMLIPALQNSKFNFIQGAALVTSLGMLSTILKDITAGREIEYEPADLILQGVDRSGLFSILMEANNIIGKATGNVVSIQNALGLRPPSRFATRNFLGALAGPTAGTIEDIGRVGAGIALEGTTKGDVRAFRKLIPYQNLFYIRKLFNEAEEGLNEVLGVKK